MKLKPIATGLTALFAFAAGSAQAQISNDTIKIGVITDMSGLYADIDGRLLSAVRSDQHLLHSCRAQCSRTL